MPATGFRTRCTSGSPGHLPVAASRRSALPRDLTPTCSSFRSSRTTISPTSRRPGRRVRRRGRPGPRARRVHGQAVRACSRRRVPRVEGARASRSSAPGPRTDFTADRLRRIAMVGGLAARQRRLTRVAVAASRRDIGARRRRRPGARRGRRPRELRRRLVQDRRPARASGSKRRELRVGGATAAIEQAARARPGPRRVHATWRARWPTSRATA